MKKFSLKKIFKKRKDSTKLYFHPKRDWRIISLTFVIFAIFVSVTHYYLFMRIINYEDTLSSIHTRDTINRMELKETLDSFRNRAVRFEELIDEPSREKIIDPSL